MYNSSDIAKRIKGVAKCRGITMKKVLADVGLGRNMMTMMDSSMPKADTLAKLADRLECSVDYLLGRTQEMLTPGTGHAPLISSALPPEATEVLNLFLDLPQEKRILLLGMARGISASTSEDIENATPRNESGEAAG